MDRMNMKRFLYEDGSRYMGDIRGEGIRHGQGTETNLDGSQYEGHWVEDKKEGLGSFKDNMGREYMGNWQGNKRHGRGTEVDEEGNVFMGEWMEDVKEGEGILFLSDEIKGGFWFKNQPLEEYATLMIDMHQNNVELIRKHSPRELLLLVESKPHLVKGFFRDERIREKLLNVSIHELNNITIRTCDLLRKRNIVDLRGILSTDMNEFLEMEHCPMKCLVEIDGLLDGLYIQKNWIGNEEKVREKLNHKKRLTKERKTTELRKPCGGCMEEEQYTHCPAQKKDICESCCIRIQLELDTKYGVKSPQNDCLECDHVVHIRYMTEYHEADHYTKIIESSFRRKFHQITMQQKTLDKNFSYVELSYGADEEDIQYSVMDRSFDNCVKKFLKLKEKLKLEDYQFYYYLGKNVMHWDIKKAIDYYNISYKLKASLKTGRAIGHCYEGLENYEKAVQWYKLSVGHKGYIYVLIAQCYEKLQKPKQAEEYYVKALSLGDDYQYLLREVGRIYKSMAMKTNNPAYYERSMDFYRRSMEWSLQEEWDKEEYLLDCGDMALCHMRLNQHEGAYEYGIIALHRFPFKTLEKGKEHVGKIGFTVIGDDHEIKEGIWKETLTGTSLTMASLLNTAMARSCYSLGKTEEAQYYMNRARSLNPKDGDIEYISQCMDGYPLESIRKEKTMEHLDCKLHQAIEYFRGFPV